MLQEKSGSPVVLNPGIVPPIALALIRSENVERGATEGSPSGEKCLLYQRWNLRPFSGEGYSGRGHASHASGAAEGRTCGFAREMHDSR